MTSADESRRAADRGMPVYPIVFGVTLFYQVVATSGVGFWVSLRPLVVVLLAVVGITLLIRLALGDADRAGPAAAFVVLGVLFGDNRILLLALLVLAVFLVERRVVPGRLSMPWRAMNQGG